MTNAMKKNKNHSTQKKSGDDGGGTLCYFMW